MSIIFPTQAKKKVVLKIFLPLTRPHSRMCIRIYIFKQTSKTKKNTKKAKDTKKEKRIQPEIRLK